MHKKLKLWLIIFVISCILIFLVQITYKIKKGGNTITKSTNDLIEDILNLSSYEATLEVTIHSNKTVNHYVLQQSYRKPYDSKQTIKEPQTIANLEIVYHENRMEVRNTNLGLNKIYESYQYINENVLWLNFFIENYKKEYNIEENEHEIILTSHVSKYPYTQKLSISKTTNLPYKMEIIDNSNQNQIYIEYKEIKLNTIPENNIFSFKAKDIRQEV